MRSTTTISSSPRIIAGSKETSGTPSKIQFSSTPTNSYSFTLITNRNRKRCSVGGKPPYPISKTSSTAKAGTTKTSSHPDGNTPSGGTLLVYLRGVPIEYYKIMISVFFNKNFFG